MAHKNFSFFYDHAAHLQDLALKFQQSTVLNESNLSGDGPVYLANNKSPQVSDVTTVITVLICFQLDLSY
jgi:hypothetical protein